MNCRIVVVTTIELLNGLINMCDISICMNYVHHV